MDYNQVTDEKLDAIIELLAHILEEMQKLRRDMYAKE